MIELNVKVSKAIIKYCGEDAEMLLKSRLSALGKPVTITNTGVVSSGKSSLYNALIDSSEERFKVGSARTTVERDTEQLTDDICIVDTPGIDIEKSDDEKALKAVLDSSIIVMVHNIKMGMLHRSEVEWLEKLASSFSSIEEISDRLVFVCSWIDTREREKDYQKVLYETKRMLFETLGTYVDFCTVSAQRYQKGKSVDKKRMIELSGIRQLKELLIKKANYYKEHYGDKSVKSDIVRMCDEDIACLSAVKADAESEGEKIKQSVEVQFNSKYKSWKTKFNSFKRIYNEYVKLRDRVTEMKGELN